MPALVTVLPDICRRWTQYGEAMAKQAHTMARITQPKRVNPNVVVVFTAISAVVHYGTKPGHFETSKIYFPTSEGVSEVSGASERGNGQASGPVLMSQFLFVPDHSV